MAKKRRFRTLFTCEARCGSFPIRKPSLAKDAKDAKKLPRNLTPLGALCDLCERKNPGSKGTKTNHGWTPMDTDFGSVVAWKDV